MYRPKLIIYLHERFVDQNRVALDLRSVNRLCVLGKQLCSSFHRKGRAWGVFGTLMRVCKCECRFKTEGSKALTTSNSRFKSVFEAYSSRRFF